MCVCVCERVRTDVRLCPSARLERGYLPLLLLVDLAADDDDLDARRRQRPDVGQPAREGRVGRARADVVDEQAGGRPSVVGPRDRPETLLAGGIPELWGGERGVCGCVGGWGVDRKPRPTEPNRNRRASVAIVLVGFSLSPSSPVTPPQDHPSRRPLARPSPPPPTQPPGRPSTKPQPSLAPPPPLTPVHRRRPTRDRGQRKETGTGNGPGA